MYKLHLIIFSALLLGGLISCKTQEVTPTTSTELVNAADIKTYIASQTWAVTPTATGSGLYFALTKASSSTVSPATGQELEFMYTLSVLIGPSSTTATSTTAVTAKLVDTTYRTTSVFFPFFTGSLKPGLQEGLLKMHEGDQAVLLMPASLAFKDVGSSDGLVPGNSAVRYDVTLVRTRTEDQQIDEYIAADKSLTLITKTASGLRYLLKTANPTGDSVATAINLGKTLTIRSVGKLLHAKTAVTFDSTGIGTYSTTLGKSLLGFDEGIKKLRVGETATLIFPSALGYSTTGLVEGGLYRVAPSTPLRYDINVVSAK